MNLKQDICLCLSSVDLVAICPAYEARTAFAHTERRCVLATGSKSWMSVRECKSVEDIGEMIFGEMVRACIFHGRGNHSVA